MSAEHLYEFICDHCGCVYHDNGPLDSCPNEECVSYDEETTQNGPSIVWNVHVLRDGQPIHLGSVEGETELVAQLAALEQFFVEPEELECGEVRQKVNMIYPDENFEVTLA